jgi:murein DD-endopeptidase MepM/ murein hydrolase activator NlpD
LRSDYRTSSSAQRQEFSTIDDRRSTILGLLLVPLVCAHVFAQRAEPSLSVALSLESVHPGDVVRVDIGGAADTHAVRASLLNRELSFDFDQERRVWSALIGVDLDTRPGTYPIRVTNGAGRSVTQPLHVMAKQFQVRRLRVAPDFVDPPPETLDQIARDNKKVAEAYARRSPKHWRGAFLLPVDGQPTSNFGTRSYYNGQRRAPHTGIDFVGEPGTPVRASNHGVVALAEPLYFTGNTVIVNYGAGLLSLFAHLSEFRVAEGDTVTPETIIGLVGATGRVTGPHLHWSVRLDGARVDPLSLVAATAPK